MFDLNAEGMSDSNTKGLGCWVWLQRLVHWAYGLSVGSGIERLQV